jgi:hypothetical protein
MIGSVTKTFARSDRMRRATLTASPASGRTTQAKEDVKLPSIEVFEAFGRFVGVLLSTVFEGRLKDFGRLPEFGDEIQRSMREALKSFGTSSGCFGSADARERPSDFCPAGKDGEVSGEKAEGVEAVEMQRELRELKRRLSKDSNCSQELCDRSLDLISRSTSFFSSARPVEYHICPYAKDSGFTGLIWYLAKVCGGNPHDKSIICATGSTTGGGNARNVADLQTASHFCSSDAADQWLCYDFKDQRVAVTHYILRSNGNGPNWYHLRSWVVEGSSDNSNWLELDCRKDDSHLNGENAVWSFEVRNVVECQFIRIRPTGPTWHGDHYLYIRAFDVFGGLRVPDSAKVVQICCSRVNPHFDFSSS